MEVDYAPTEEEIKERDGEVVVSPDDFVYVEPGVAEQVISPLIPPIAFGLTAFAVVGLVIWAGQRMSHAVKQSNYTQTISRAENYDATDGAQPAQPGIQVAFAAPPPGSSVLPAPHPHIANGAALGPLAPLDRSLVTGPFIGVDSRNAAKRSLRPIQDLLALMHRYDQKGLWPNDGAAATIRAAAGVSDDVSTPANGVAPVTLASPSQLAMNNAAANSTRGATFQGGFQSMAPPTPNPVATAIEAIDRIHLRTDSLGTQTDLTLLPEQYPEPLRDDVKAVAQELHLYLKDADVAATADSDERTKLRQHASQRLSGAQRVYDHMNAVIDGKADVHFPPQL